MKRCKVLILLLAASTLGWAQNADEVMDKWQKAMYGNADIETVFMRGTVTLPMGSAKSETYLKKGGKVNFHMNLMDQVKTWQGCDGTDCYSQDPMGLRLLEGQERELFQTQNDFLSRKNWRELYTEVKYIGKETLDGKEYIKMMLTSKAGATEENYYDPETYLIHKSIITAETPMGRIPATMVVKEYGEIEGLRYPKVAEMSMMNMTMTNVIDEVNVNIPIPDSKFKLPEGL